MGRETRQTRRARERREQQQQQHRNQASQVKNHKWSIGVVAGLLGLVVAALVIAAFMKNAGSSHATVATATAQAQFTPVPGQARGPAQCTYNEMVNSGFYHVHGHVTILHNGKDVPVQDNIGFNTDHDCLFWVHTHQPSHGIIHVESPYKIEPTLGNFFQIWGEKFSRNQVAKFRGPVRVYVNEKVFRGDPTAIKILAHTDITIEVGGPWTAPKKFNFAKYQV